MNKKNISMLLLIAVIFISLSLVGYSFLVSNHASMIPVLNTKEGYGEIKPAVQATETPVEPATPSTGGLATSSYSAPVTSATSGQYNANKQASSQESKQTAAHQVTASA